MHQRPNLIQRHQATGAIHTHREVRVAGIHFTISGGGGADDLPVNQIQVNR